MTYIFKFPLRTFRVTGAASRDEAREFVNSYLERGAA